MKPLLVIAASSFGRLAGVLAQECGRDVAGFIDDTKFAEDILGTTADLGHDLTPYDYDLVMAIGYKHLDARLALFRRLCAAEFDFPSLIHPTARVSPHATIGNGTMVMANADVDAFTAVGDACVIWPNATVSHDSKVGCNTFISPAATLCGFVTIGQGSFIGANSTIVDGSTLQDGAFVKASTRHHIKTQAR